MHADLLRQIATELRKEAAAHARRTTVKCAQVLDAALALTLLRNKVNPNVR